jgi:UDP-N-acetylglucosamine 3-dehydrogenase
MEDKRMSKQYSTALFGLGKIAYAHMSGYLASENAERINVIACADPSEEASHAFADRYKISAVYSDYIELLKQEKPDIVSICTWPPLHAEMVEASASAGVKGILCEKPMCVNLDEADRMVNAAREANTVLIVGHQRRLEARYVKACELINEGAIGTLVQITAICGGDLLTDGTHSLDLVRFMNNDVPASWVIGNVDLRDRGAVDTSSRSFGFQKWNETHTRYGHPVETGASAVIHFSNGVRGTLEGGICSRPGYQRMWIYGSEGLMEISGDGPVAGEPPLRVLSRGNNDWIVPELSQVNSIAREISLLLDSIETGKLHPLDGTSARANHEILMAVFESALKRGRIDLPLMVKKHPILSLI